MPAELYPWMHLAGRILFTLIFVVSGLTGHIFNMKGSVAYAEMKGAPAPKVLVPVTGVMIAVGGAMVLLGWHRFIGAGLLVIFLVPVSYYMHAFWKVSDPMMMANERAHFMKNMSMLGAALVIAFYAGDPWPLSVGP